MISISFLLLTLHSLLIKHTQSQIPCRHGEHKMLVLLTENTLFKTSIGLKKYDYTFFLLSSYDIKNNYQIAFTGYFPINSNIDLNLNTIYQFIPEDFCLNHLIYNSVHTLKGNLKEYYSNTIVLTNTFVNFEKMIVDEQIDSIKKQSNEYYLMTRVNCNKDSTEVILMKTLFEEIGAFLQFVRATVSFDKAHINEEQYIEMGMKLEIKWNTKKSERRAINNSNDSNSDLGEFGMRSGETYSSILQVGSQLKYLRFDKVENLVCLKGRNMDSHCNIS